MDKVYNFFYEGELGKWIAPCKSDKALLFEAVSSGNRRQYEEMKARGTVNLLEKNSAQNTLLHVAAYSGRIEYVQECLNEGLDINLRGNRRRTPLHMACQQGKKPRRRRFQRQKKQRTTTEQVTKHWRSFLLKVERM